MTIAKVIVDVPTRQINKTFDYLIPDRFKHILEPGMRVIVPFGPRKIMGFVVDRSDNTSQDIQKLKGIDEVLDFVPVLTKELLELGKWLAADTLSFYITAYQAMLPQVLKAKYKKELSLQTDASLGKEMDFLFAGKQVIPFEQFEQSTIPYTVLQKAIKNGDIQVHYLVKSRVTKKKVTMVEPAVDRQRLEEAFMDISQQAKKQKEILAFFTENEVPIERSELLKRMETTGQTVQALVKKSILRQYQKEVYRNPYNDQAFQRTFPLELTKQQRNAIEPIINSIYTDKHDIFLLHGITGSGKTEIYLQAIQQVIDKGMEAIVLVPEISLTPQMVNRFKGRFGSNVAVMHSALSSGEKYDEWRKIHQKEVKVVVGARSAVFAPFENIGIIIIDEEHETTYKQEDQPRYHARDVAIERGKYHSCPVVLGSATPALETFARAQKGVYKLASLNERTNKKPLPKVDIVDMRAELHAGNRTMFSQMLMEKMKEAIDRHEQIVLLLNRRGYSTFVMCRDCGHVIECPHCDIALTYHRNSNMLKCHYCAYEIPMPNECPACSSDAIRYFGTGTQKVEEALTRLLPEATVIRMDVDTTRKKGAHERLLKKFADHEGDILLGTQMIAKGLDFANVTLVGVLTADSMLHLPDFRSAEKTFQLLTQVSGRAGRHELPGEVIVQTYTPDNYSIQLAATYDYQQFFLQEMRTRKVFQYPPYVFLVLITISDENHASVIQAAQKMVKMLLEKVRPETTVLGPTPSPVLRVKDRYRYQCMIKYKNEPQIRQYIEDILVSFKDVLKKDGLQIVVDMQPYQLM